MKGTQLMRAVMYVSIPAAAAMGIIVACSSHANQLPSTADAEAPPAVSSGPTDAGGTVDAGASDADAGEATDDCHNGSAGGGYGGGLPPPDAAPPPDGGPCCLGFHVWVPQPLPKYCSAGQFWCLAGRCGDGVCEPGEGSPSFPVDGTTVVCGCANDCLPDGGSTGVVVPLDAGADAGDGG